MFRFDRKYIRNVVAGTWAIVSLSLGWCVSYAQGVDTLGANTSPTSAAAATVDTEALSKRIELIADAESLDDATKSRLLEQLRLAQARQPGAPAPARLLLLRRQSRISCDPVAGCTGKPGLRGGDGRGIGLTGLHEQPRLAVGDMAARQ